MQPSVAKQLEEFLKARTGEKWASGDLQRVQWKNKNGTLATPRSIVRRLEELTEDKILNVSYVNGSAQYEWNDGKENPARKKQQIVEYLPDRTVKITYV